MNDWKESNIKSLGTVFTNNTFSRDCLNYDSGEYQNIHYGDVLITFSDVIDANSPLVPYINSNETVKSDTFIEDGDIIVADTAEDETVGKVCEIQNVGKRKIVSGLHTLWYRPNKNEFAPKYLGYLLNTFECHKQLVRKAHGIKVLSINKVDFWKTIIKYPASLNEQNAIAGIISKVDQCIENVQKTIDATQKLKKSLMQNLLTGRMKPDGTMRKDNEFYEHPKMGKVPIGWDVKKLKDITLNRGDYGSNSSAVPFSKETPRFIRITDISDDGQLFENDAVSSTDTTEKYLLNDDDFLFARTGDTVGKSLLYKEKMGNAIFAGYLIRFVLNKEIIIPEYFDLIAKSEFFESFKVSMKRVGVKPNINSREYCSFKFIIPTSKNEQLSILKYFNPISSKKIELNQKIIYLKRLKKSLMQNLLTGKKRVNVDKINALLESMK